MDGGEPLELQCPICFGESDGGYASLLCGHVYHATCLSRALQNKRECPQCRCPAKPVDSRREGHPKCPCKTGQPVKLFNLNKRAGVAMSPLPGGAVVAAAEGQDTAALLAAQLRAEKRETRLREALDGERQRVTELEKEVDDQKAEVTALQDKAERRKHRLATLEATHQESTRWLTADKQRLEVRVRELDLELTRREKMLHKERMEADKARMEVAEKDQQVMRAKREVAAFRARMGGAAPTAAELTELAGDDKECWGQLYSIAVEERQKAQGQVGWLQEQLHKGTVNAEAREAAARLAGQEQVKEKVQELDRKRREVMDLEYKLHQAERRLAEAQQNPSQPSLTPTPTPPAAPAVAGHAAVLMHMPTTAAGGASCAPPPLAGGNQKRPRPPGTVPNLLQPQRQQHQPQWRHEWERVGTCAAAGDSGSQPAPPHAAAVAAESARPAAPAAGHLAPGALGRSSSGAGGRGGAEMVVLAAADDGVAEEEDDELALLAAYCPDGDGDGSDADANGGSVGGSGNAGDGRCDGSARRGQQQEEEWDVEDMDYEGPAPCGVSDGCGLAAAPAQSTLAAGMRLGSGGGGGAAGTSGRGSDSGCGAGGAPDGDVEVLEAVCGSLGDPVPMLPRAFGALYGTASGGGLRAAATAVPAGRGLAAAGGMGLSFARQAASSGAFGRSGSGGSFIGEGPDGRGGTTRFPLVSSYATNKMPPSKAPGKAPPAVQGGGGGGGAGKGGSKGGGAHGRQPVAASKRIDAYMVKPPPPPPPQRR